MLDWFGRLALELVAQGGLGYTFNSLDPDAEDNEYRKAMKEYMYASLRPLIIHIIYVAYSPTMAGLQVLLPFSPLISRWPSWLLRFGAKFVPLPMLHNAIRITDVMHRYSKEVFDEKKALLQKGDDMFKHQLSEGKDIISVLSQSSTSKDVHRRRRTDDGFVLGTVKTNGDASEEDMLPEEEILGQMSYVAPSF